MSLLSLLKYSDLLQSSDHKEGAFQIDLKASHYTVFVVTWRSKWIIHSTDWLPGNKPSYPLPHLNSTNKRSLQLANLRMSIWLVSIYSKSLENDEKWLLRSLKNKICLGLNMYIWRTCQVCSIFKPWATCLAWTDVFDVFYLEVELWHQGDLKVKLTGIV